MSREEENPEFDIFELDWASFSERDKDDIIKEHINYVILSRRVVEANGAYLANIRSLILLLFTAFVMALFKVDNRTIALTIMGLQFVKTLLSRLVEANVLEVSRLAKENLSNFLSKKVKSLKNV
jgi:hypothetical protein